MDCDTSSRVAFPRDLCLRRKYHWELRENFEQKCVASKKVEKRREKKERRRAGTDLVPYQKCAAQNNKRLVWNISIRYTPHWKQALGRFASYDTGKRPEKKTSTSQRSANSKREEKNPRLSLSHGVLPSTMSHILRKYKTKHRMEEWWENTFSGRMPLHRLRRCR